MLTSCLPTVDSFNGNIIAFIIGGNPWQHSGSPGRIDTDEGWSPCWKTTGKNDQYVLYNFLFKSSHIHQNFIRASTFFVRIKSFKTSRKESFRTYVTWTVPQSILTLSKDTCFDTHNYYII